MFFSFAFIPLMVEYFTHSTHWITLSSAVTDNQDRKKKKLYISFPGQPKRRPLRGRLLQYSIDIRDNYARLRRENGP